jgi:hypothetical protein
MLQLTTTADRICEMKHKSYFFYPFALSSPHSRFAASKVEINLLVFVGYPLAYLFLLLLLLLLLLLIFTK